MLPVGIYSVKPVVSLRQLWALAKLVLLLSSDLGQSVVLVVKFLRVGRIYLVSVLRGRHTIMHIWSSHTSSESALGSVRPWIWLRRQVSIFVNETAVAVSVAAFAEIRLWMKNIFRFNWKCIQINRQLSWSFLVISYSARSWNVCTIGVKVWCPIIKWICLRLAVSYVFFAAWLKLCILLISLFDSLNKTLLEQVLLTNICQLVSQRWQWPSSRVLVSKYLLGSHWFGLGLNEQLLLVIGSLLRRGQIRIYGFLFLKVVGVLLVKFRDLRCRNCWSGLHLRILLVPRRRVVISTSSIYSGVSVVHLSEIQGILTMHQFLLMFHIWFFKGLQLLLKIEASTLTLLSEVYVINWNGVVYLYCSRILAAFCCLGVQSMAAVRIWNCGVSWLLASGGAWEVIALKWYAALWCLVTFPLVVQWKFIWLTRRSPWLISLLESILRFLHFSAGFSSFFYSLDTVLFFVT